MRAWRAGCVRRASRLAGDCGPRTGPGSGSRIPSTRQPFLLPKRRERLPRRAGPRTVRWDSPGKERIRYVAERELGHASGPTCGIRLVAATLDPSKLDPDNTWYLATSLSICAATTEPVYEISRLGDAA